MGRSRSRSPRKKKTRKRSRSRERKRRRHSSSDSDSDHKRRRDKTSTGHRKKSRSRSRERRKHDRRRRSRSQDRKMRKRSSSSSSPVKELKQEDDKNLVETGAEKVRARLKMLLEQQEKKRREEDKMVVERILTVPSSAQLAKIDKEGFHQQKFKSDAKSSTAVKGKKSSQVVSTLPVVTTSSELDHDNAMFGSERVSLSTAKSSVTQEKPLTVSVNQLPSSEKQARWLHKLQQMRSKFSKPPSDQPTETPD